MSSSISVGSSAMKSTEDRQMIVLMRSLGHDVLLAHGDTTSRILPIEQVGDQYIIRFDTKFQLKSSTLIAVVDEAVKRNDIATNYLVEMEECESERIMYSYQVNGVIDLGSIPCSTREQPVTCYNLLFTILDGSPVISSPILNTSLPVSPHHEEANTTIVYGGSFALLLLASIGMIYYKRRSVEPIHIHKIGAYNFDTQRMVLSLADRDVELTSKESDLLALLFASANTTLERQDILLNVWGDKGDYIGRTLDVFISKLRKKLEGDPNVKITNIKGVGYRLVV